MIFSRFNARIDSYNYNPSDSYPKKLKNPKNFGGSSGGSDSSEVICVPLHSHLWSGLAQPYFGSENF